MKDTKIIIDGYIWTNIVEFKLVGQIVSSDLDCLRNLSLLK